MNIKTIIFKPTQEISEPKFKFVKNQNSVNNGSGKSFEPYLRVLKILGVKNDK